MHIAKLHRQHSSVVMTVPKALCQALGISGGDYVVLVKKALPENKYCIIMEKWEVRNVGDSRDSDREDSGGGA